jgi:hypothetical protein
MLSKTKENIKETKIGQIWSVKNNNSHSSKERIDAYIRNVQLVTPVEYENGVYAVNIRPISFEIQYQAQDDAFITKTDLFDDPFIIEYWNEQTMNAELLDELVGEFEVQQPYDGPFFELTDEQKQFRSREIESTAFLRQGVFSAIFEQEEARSTFNGITYMKIAASLLLIAMVSFSIWNYSLPSDEFLVSTYGTTVIHGFDLSIPDNAPTRGENCGIDNLEGDECDAARKALSLYEDANYKEAAEALSKLLTPRQKSDNLTYYMALSYFYSDQPAIAIDHFKFLLNQSSFQRKDDANFFMALSYLKNGDRNLAKKKLKSITNSESPYLKRAEQILHDMRFF